MSTEPKTRVLIAEDDAMVAMVIQYMLEDRGCEVVGIAKDGLSAVESVVELRPDVVVLDLQMPDIDGLEVTRRIMQRCPVPVIALTAHSVSEWGEEAFEAGVVGFLEKPATADQLAAAITAARSSLRL